MTDNNGRLRVGLALGGGGVRGLAHIGVLQGLVDARIPIDCVAGTSVGAVIGAAYCAGLELPQLWELAAETSWTNFGRLTTPTTGLLNFDPLEAWMIDLIGDVDIRDLSIPFAAVVTDLASGERVILREGRLASAVRASCSVPGIVKPLEVDGQLLCDGGISDNVPVGAVRMLGADYIIGVDIFAHAPRPRLGPLGIGVAAIENLVRHAGGGDSMADCLIAPRISGQTYMRFSKWETLIALGEQGARRRIPHIRAALKKSAATPPQS